MNTSRVEITQFISLYISLEIRFALCFIDVKMKQDILGHNSVNVTLDIYIHLDRENKKLSADKLEKYIFSQSKISQNTV